jgi:hypothetical protein
MARGVVRGVGEALSAMAWVLVTAGADVVDSTVGEELGDSDGVIGTVVGAVGGGEGGAVVVVGVVGLGRGLVCVAPPSSVELGAALVCPPSCSPSVPGLKAAGAT